MARREMTWLIDPSGPELAWLAVTEENDRVRIVDAGVERGAETAAEALKQLEQRALHAKIRMKDCWVLFPPERLACRGFKVPRLTGERLQQAIRFEVSEALGLDDAELSWDAIGEGGDEICWLAARTADIKELIGMMPESFPAMKALVPGFVAGQEAARAALHSQEPMLFIISRSHSLTMAIRSDTQLLACRTVALRERNLLPEDKARFASREVQRLLLFAEEQHPDIDIQRCVIAGIEAKAIREYLRIPGVDTIPMAIEEICALPDIRIAEAVPLEEAHFELLGTVWFLARKQRLPNLLPTEKRIEQLATLPEVLKTQKAYFVTAGLLVLAGIVLAVGGRWAWAAAVESRIERAEALLTDMNVLQEEERGLREVLQRRVEFPLVFKTLSEKLPQSVTLIDANFDLDGRVNLKGKAGGQQEVNQVLEILMGTNVFNEITPRRTSNEEKGFIFEMEGTLKKGKKRS